MKKFRKLFHATLQAVENELFSPSYSDKVDVGKHGSQNITSTPTFVQI